MASPTETRTVSELIEVWQDWTTFIEQKKRSRRWTMDETLRASDSELGDENNGRGKRKKRGRYSDGHEHLMLRNCMSFPEEMDVSFVHEESVRGTASVDENNLSLQLDISDVQDVNLTHLSIGDTINESIVHIGCIDSDGNPLDLSGEQPKPALRRPTDVSTDSPDELKLYSSICKSIDVVTPMKLSRVFRDKEQSETDRSTREDMDAIESAHAIEAETTSAASVDCQSASDDDQVSKHYTKQQQDGLDQSMQSGQSSEKIGLDCEADGAKNVQIQQQQQQQQQQQHNKDDEHESIRQNNPSERSDATQIVDPSDVAMPLDAQESNLQSGMDQVFNDGNVPDRCGANEKVSKQASQAILCASTEQTNVEPDINNCSSINCEGASESDENLDPKSTRGASKENSVLLVDEKVSNEPNGAVAKKTAVRFDGANASKKSVACISAEKADDATDVNDSKENNLPTVTFKDEREGTANGLNLSSHQPLGAPTYSQQQHQENKPPNRTTEHQHDRNSLKSKRKKPRSRTATVEQNATFAFSPYRTIIPLSNLVKSEDAHNVVSLLSREFQPSNDSVLEQYLDEMNLMNDFYTKAQPFRMGNRNIPFNQVEVVLRRRAIKKPKKVQPSTIGSSASLDGRSTQSSNAQQGSNTPPTFHSEIPRPPSKESQSITPRRTLFPNIPGHSRSHSLGMDTAFEDDSTISSATVSTAWTAGNISNNASVLQPSDPILEESGMQMPQEEVVGDTSLGLKLTILHGKVIVQALSSLEDGRASPAQLCGLFCPGDVLVAVNDSPLIIGSIHTPVPMDKMVSALKPLSEPIDGDGRYSREVRLRFVIGEGRKLLREQKEREIRKQRVINERKRLGLDGKAGSASFDHASDIFGLSALMGVDQHTGLPMFQQHHLETYLDEKVDEETVVDVAVSDTPIDNAPDSDKQLFRPSFFTKIPPLIQTRISQQLAEERKRTRNHNRSDFFTLDSKASLLLRPPSPPVIEQPEDQFSHLNPSEARQKRLELGALNVAYAKELISTVEKQERGIDIHDDEDPMEVASRVCGTASVRTGASRRRWHRADSLILEDAPSTVVSASSMDNQADTNTLHSAESVEMCDHRLLVELAANNISWKRNVIKRLEEYASVTEKAIREEHNEADALTEKEVPSSLDSLLFGSEVATMLKKKKSSLALPPGEMTQMLFDLKEHLESGLPMHIFTSEDALTLNGSERAVTFAKTPLENDVDVSKATNFLINEALGIWLKSFRPLPWKQRRALWPLQLHGTNGESSSMVSSHFDDGMSLSLASGGTHSTTKAEKRNLREIIEELELDPETKRETCSLVTFYFTRTYQPSGHIHFRLSQEEETMALDLIDSYGSYLDLYKSLVLAGKLQCQSMVMKLVSLAKYDPCHREAMQGLQKAKVLLFYEPNMLSALHELLQSGTYNLISSNFDITRLLVSAYPDLPPMSVKAAASNASSADFYFNYMSMIMHPDEGSDLAKRDGSLVKEWCFMLSSSVESHDEKSEDSIASFHQIASASDEFSSLYHRDLSFLLDTSIRMLQYELALEIAKEMISSFSPKHGNSASVDLLRHLRHLSEIAIVETVNSDLLGQVVAFYTVMGKRDIDAFDVSLELTKIFQQCIEEGKRNPSYDTLSNLNSCCAVLAENASPSEGIHVLSQLDTSLVDQQFMIRAIQTLLTRGARENAGSEISGSLLRIQRVREERWRFEKENLAVHNNLDHNKTTGDDDVEELDGFIWPSILKGRAMITK